LSSTEVRETGTYPLTSSLVTNVIACVAAASAIGLPQPILLHFVGTDRKPPPLLMRSLPVNPWANHLLPLLTCKDAARLACTCKAVRGVVREHFKDLGRIEFEQLRAALTTFPRARAVAIADSGPRRGGAQEEAVTPCAWGPTAGTSRW
jgi:hypothetical protein